MSKWQDDLTLIRLVPTGKDADGFELPPTEERRLIFCNKLNIGQGEFYKATQAGIKVEAKCEVHTADYHGETLCEFEGKKYGVLRTYSPDSGEFTELTLTDIKQTEGGGYGEV